MKLRNLFNSLLLIVGLALVSTPITSCSDDDDTLIIISYHANGSLSGTTAEALEIPYAYVDYNEAIEDVFGSTYTTSENDKAVIEACDAVYAIHCEKYSTWDGYIEIMKTKTDENGATVSDDMLKRYEYTSKED